MSIILSGIMLVQCAGQTDHTTTGSVIRLDPEIDRIVPPGALPEILAEGFDWSEGPLWLPDQEALIFSDIPQNSIFRWDEKEGLQLYLKPSGYTGSIPRGGESGSNGLLLDPQGRLVLCQHGDRRMARMESPLDYPSPDFLTLADRWEGKRFNSPNDAAFRKDGTLYFTDPAYGMEFGYRDERREMDYTGVFMLRPDGEVSLITDQFSAPNGIGLSPDETQMYVANSGGATGSVWMEFDISEDGTPVNQRIFYDARPAADTLRGGPDGLVVRSDGIIFATGPGGVWILKPEGKHLGIIRTGQATSNCTLDAEEKYLYMTADMYLMRIRLL